MSFFFNKINLLISESRHLVQPRLLSPNFIIFQKKEQKQKHELYGFKFRQF